MSFGHSELVNPVSFDMQNFGHKYFSVSLNLLDYTVSIRLSM